MNRRGRPRAVTRPGGLCFVWTDWRQLAAFTHEVEYAVWGSNGDMPVHRVVYPSSVVEAARPRDRVHIAQKPESVLAHMLSIAPEKAVVLDPFTGSGSALLAARQLGHRAIGVELDERFLDVPSRRASATA